MGPCPRTHELGPAIDGTRRRWRPEGHDVGEVCLYMSERRPGRPLVLVHDLRATSSAYEMRPLFECYRWRRPTIAPDLPGFGLSDRSERPYGPALFAAVLGKLLREPRRSGLAPDVVALGRGAEIAAQVAHDDPGSLRSLVLLEPSGLVPVRGAGLERLGAQLGRLFGERTARTFFALLAARPLVRRSLGARFSGLPDAGLVAYAHACVLAPGAHRAPLGAVSHSPRRSEAASVYHALALPVLVVHGVRRAAELEAFLRARANRCAVRLPPTRGMPQFERRHDTMAALDRFWQTLPRAACDRATR